MKKILFFVSAISSLLLATSEIQTCKKCHPQIVDEFETSMHKNSTYLNDEIHKAVWEKHPLKADNNYTCAACHAPNTKNEQEVQNGITCTTCHTIQNIEEHTVINKNIYGSDKKTFYSAEAGREKEKVVYKTESSMFGLSKKTVGSPYHNLDYTNEIFYDGKVCMGCHSHRQNSHGFELCKTDKESAGDKKQNCITCHMPKVDGSATTIRESKQHAFHGFAGSAKHPEMLAKYIELDFVNKSEGFDITISNNSPHNLLTHPLRVAQLKVNLIKNGKSTTLQTTDFLKVIGVDGKPAMPWLAKEVLVDTMIKANEKRVLNHTTPLKAGDEIEVVLGYYLVNPKALENLGLKGNKEAEKFIVLKKKNFIVK